MHIFPLNSAGFVPFCVFKQILNFVHLRSAVQRVIFAICPHVLSVRGMFWGVGLLRTLPLSLQRQSPTPISLLKTKIRAKFNPGMVSHLQSDMLLCPQSLGVLKYTLSRGDPPALDCYRFTDDGHLFVELRWTSDVFSFKTSPAVIFFPP